MVSPVFFGFVYFVLLLAMTYHLTMAVEYACLAWKNRRHRPWFLGHLMTTMIVICMIGISLLTFIEMGYARDAERLMEEYLPAEGSSTYRVGEYVLSGILNFLIYCI